jgi:hypothetical protein
MSQKSWLLPSLVIISVTISPVHAATSLMVEKNLFSQERKPSSGETPTPTVQTGPPLPPKAIQLDGIMIHGNIRKALLRLKGGSSPKEKGKKDSPFTTVREGEKVSDYTVTKIGTRSVSLEKGGQTFEVFLYAEGKVLPPLAATPGPGPAAVPGQPGQPPAPSGVQGAAIPPDSDAEGNQGRNPAMLRDPNSPAHAAALQRQRGSRRTALPPAEPADLDEGAEEDIAEDIDQ